jgi:methylated-DNA-protein-cysteine methyltransferase-like protein
MKKGVGVTKTKAKTDSGLSPYQQVYKIVQRIPKGKVLTYGMISHHLGGRLSAQAVGWALKALPTEVSSAFSVANTPWHRVINSQGRLSTHKNANIPPDLQRELLEKEGIKFNEEEAIDLNRYLWLDLAKL